MINKEEQRRRAAELDRQLMASGIKKPVLSPIPTPAKTELPPALRWPFPTTNTPAAIPTKPIPGFVASKKSAKITYDEASFTNHLNQSIQVGQRVIAIRSGYSRSTKVGIGTFLGVRLKNGRVSTVVVRLEEKNRKGQNIIRQTSLPGKRIYPTI
jgi:hypothetical protein